jgi:hypothetical protein
MKSGPLPQEPVSGPCFPPRPSDLRTSTRGRTAPRSHRTAIIGIVLVGTAILTIPARDLLFGPAQQVPLEAYAQWLAIGRGSNARSALKTPPQPGALPSQVVVEPVELPEPLSVVAWAAPESSAPPSELILEPVEPPLLLSSADLLQPQSLQPQSEPQPPERAELLTIASALEGGLLKTEGLGTMAASAPLETGSFAPLSGKPAEPQGPTASTSDLTVGFTALRTQPLSASPTSRVAALGNVVIMKGSTGPAPRVDSDRLLLRAQKLIADGDISGARLMLERALADGSDRAAFQLAETYDPRMLLEWRVVGLLANSTRARELYGIAADRGVTAARERLVGLD